MQDFISTCFPHLYTFVGSACLAKLILLCVALWIAAAGIYICICGYMQRAKSGKRFNLRRMGCMVKRFARGWLRDEEEFDAEWMDEAAWRRLSFEDRRDRWSR